MRYRSDIDGLRAISVLLVVAFHAFPEKFPNGFVGVDVFFVISGFLITNIILMGFREGHFSFAEFFIRRAKRLLPALTTVITATLIAGWFLLLSVEYSSLGKHVFGATVFTSNIFLYGEHSYFDTASEFKPLLHLWSLAIEEQYYLIWPLLLFAVSRSGVSLVPAVVGMLLLALGYRFFFGSNDPAASFFLMQFRAWELLVGSALAATSFHLHQKQCGSNACAGQSFRGIGSARKVAMHVQGHIFTAAISAIGLCAIVLPVLLAKNSYSNSSWFLLFPTLGAALVIASGSQNFTSRHMLGNKLLVYIGLISFPLYLWHWPILSIAYIIHPSHVTAISKIVLIIFSFILAWLTFEHFEKPWRQGRTSKRQLRVLICSFLVVGILGIAININQGFEKRLTADLTFKSAKRFDMTEHSSACQDKYPGIWDCTISINDSIKDRPEVVFLGDSHALALVQSMPTHHKNVAFLQIGKMGCPHFPNTDRISYGERYSCNIYYDIIMELFAGMDLSKTTLVTTAYFTAYASGTSFNGVDAKHIDNGGVEIISLQHDNEQKLAQSNVFEMGFSSSIAELAKLFHSVLVVLQPPELGAKLSSCINRPLMPKNEACMSNIQDVKGRQSSYRQVFIKEASKYNNVSTVETMDLFCDDMVCGPLDGTVSLYRDHNHISPEGSRRILSRLSKFW